MLAWLAPIVVFGLVVFVHELGHFIAAKIIGVYAPRFSIGFGPAIFRKRWGETEYVLAALPLGGYVRMASREDEATAFLEGGSEEPMNTPGLTDAPATERELPRPPKDWDPNAMMPFGPKPIPPNRWFESKPLPARIFILIAGVTMNAVLAIVVYTTLFAAYASPEPPPVIGEVLAGTPAQRAGLLAGDSIVAIDGQPLQRWGEVLDRVTAAPGRELRVDVARAGARVALQIRPESTAVPNPINGHREIVGRIGAAVRPKAGHVGLGQSFVSALKQTGAMSTSVVGVVRGLFSGDVPLSQLGGPVAIARTSVQAARGGLEQLLGLIAFLSINVAILNLFPVPILDGGQILLNVVESAKGSAFSERTHEMILRAGLLAIALLFALVMYNDLKDWVVRGVQKIFG